ncbi:hypothetical protein L914_12957 [Phytophthora nicotianae]|uniref:RxLR effector protein n=1 Tax=Phytophthora nicotianae TaxID=4792 RepID=W2MY37_PHYNI|nr:hypothetical protein L914_12957 [Phytophthora nicotianae]
MRASVVLLGAALLSISGVAVGATVNIGLPSINRSLRHHKPDEERFSVMEKVFGRSKKNRENAYRRSGPTGQILDKTIISKLKNTHYKVELLNYLNQRSVIIPKAGRST